MLDRLLFELGKQDRIMRLVLAECIGNGGKRDAGVMPEVNQSIQDTMGYSRRNQADS